MSIIRFPKSGIIRVPAGIGVDQFAGAALGPELVNFASQTWSIGLQGGGAGTVTQDASGIHFNGAANLANANLTVTAGDLADNGQYLTVCTLSGSGVHGQLLLYGQTNNHLGNGTTHNAAGTFTEILTLNAATTAQLNQIRFRATGTAATNFFDVTSLSVRRILG